MDCVLLMGFHPNKELVKHNDNTVLATVIMKLDGEPIGNACIAVDDGVVKIHDVGVLEEFRCQGIGKFLLDRVSLFCDDNEMIGAFGWVDNDVFDFYVKCNWLVYPHKMIDNKTLMCDRNIKKCLEFEETW